jgi:hypothetical protein
MVTSPWRYISPRFHLGQSVSVLWYLDDRPIREIGVIAGLVLDCPHLGLGWVYAINRMDDPEFPQSWFDESDLTPLLPAPQGIPCRFGRRVRG